MPKHYTRHVFLMELRKVIAYRADFWINFIGQTIFSVGIAYFLWQSIFNFADSKTINGHSIEYMIFYYLMVPLIFRIQQGQGIGFISREIYDGTLNKYLLYPIKIFDYKLSTYMANSFFYFLQLLFILLLYKILFYQDNVYSFSLVHFSFFILSTFIGTLTFFFFFSTSELLAFWFDNTWSLGVILRFFTTFFGGALLPLSFFPLWAQEVLEWTPFPYFLNFPLDCLLGNISFEGFLLKLLISIFWLLFFKFLCLFIWKQGRLQYTGVGI